MENTSTPINQSYEKIPTRILLWGMPVLFFALILWEIPDLGQGKTIFSGCHIASSLGMLYSVIILSVLVWNHSSGLTGEMLVEVGLILLFIVVLLYEIPEDYTRRAVDDYHALCMFTSVISAMQAIFHRN